MGTLVLEPSRPLRSQSRNTPSAHSATRAPRRSDGVEVLRARTVQAALAASGHGRSSSNGGSVGAAQASAPVTPVHALPRLNVKNEARSITVMPVILGKHLGGGQGDNSPTPILHTRHLLRSGPAPQATRQRSTPTVGHAAASAAAAAAAANQLAMFSGYGFGGSNSSSGVSTPSASSSYASSSYSSSNSSNNSSTGSSALVSPASFSRRSIHTVNSAHRRLSSTPAPAPASQPAARRALVARVPLAKTEVERETSASKEPEVVGIEVVAITNEVPPPDQEQEEIVVPKATTILPPAQTFQSFATAVPASSPIESRNSIPASPPAGSPVSRPSRSPEDARSNMVSPTSFVASQVNPSKWTDENPEFVAYKQRWEAMRELQTQLRKAGGIKEGRSLLSPTTSHCGTRNQSRVTSVAHSRATSPRALSPSVFTSRRALSPYGHSTFSPASAQHDSPSRTHISGSHHISLSTNPSPLPGPCSPTELTDTGMRSPLCIADGVTSFEFPVPLPVDELGDELATQCSALPGPFVHCGSAFAILAESNRSSPLPMSGIPGYLLLSPIAGSVSGSGSHQRSRSVSGARLMLVPTSPPSSLPSSRSVSRSSRRRTLPTEANIPAVAAIPEEPSHTRDNSSTDWTAVQSRLKGLVESAAAQDEPRKQDLPSSPPQLSAAHPSPYFFQSVHSHSVPSALSPQARAPSGFDATSAVQAALVNATISPSSRAGSRLNSRRATRTVAIPQPVVVSPVAPNSAARADGLTLRPSRRSLGAPFVTPSAVAPVAANATVAASVVLPRLTR